jgi:hypothetical protein
VVEIERHLFLGNQIITLSPATHIKLSTAEHAKSHQFFALAFQSFTFPFTARCTAPTPRSMASRADQIPNVIGGAIIDEGKTHSGGESDVLTTSSSSKEAIAKMVNKTTSVLSNYWKKSMITKADRSSYHTVGWLGDTLESFVPIVEVPMVDNSIVVCFKSHLITGLGLPPSKFLVSILNFIGCELVHLNPNAITALSCFTMLCEC